MDTHIKKFSAFVGAFVLALGGSYAQDREYDDLYFTSNDRNKVKKVKVENKVVQDADQVQQLDPNPQESYSSKTVNPEYIARYQAKSQEDYSSDSEYTEGEYFDENYQSPEAVTTNFQQNANYSVRDRYGNVSYYNDFNDIYWSDPIFYRGTVYDPFYRPYYGYGYGYRPWRSGWSVSIGFGNTWGWRSGWYSGFSIGYGWGWNSWYDPYYAYDPFYCPPYSRFGYSYGGYYGYPYRNVVVINNYESRSDRTFKRGPGMSRSGDLAVNNRNRRSASSGTGNISTGRSSTTGRTSSDAPTGRYINTSNTRDYSDTQSRYYRRSREAVSTSSSDTQGRTYDSRSRSTSNYSTESNRSTSRSNSSYERSSNSRSRSYDYNNNSRSNSRSYSTPSRSNSNSNRYYNGGSSNSRSSGSYSSGSRSSSRSSGSYSSGSNSRSSGSNSRSSGSSRSSRRGGN